MEDIIKMVETGILTILGGAALTPVPLSPDFRLHQAQVDPLLSGACVFFFHLELTVQPLTGRKDCLISSAISGVWHRACLLSAAYEMSVEATRGRTLPSYFCCRNNSYMEPETAFLENLGKYTGKKKKKRQCVCVGG